MLDHKSQVLSEIAGMTSRDEIAARMNRESNTTVRIWIWQYLQTL